jgi:hypothetical protein
LLYSNLLANRLLFIPFELPSGFTLYLLIEAIPMKALIIISSLLATVPILGTSSPVSADFTTSVFHQDYAGAGTSTDLDEATAIATEDLGERFAATTLCDGGKLILHQGYNVVTLDDNGYTVVIAAKMTCTK